MKYRPVEDEVREYQEHLERRAGASYPHYPKRRSTASWVQLSADLVWLITLLCAGMLRLEILLSGMAVTVIADATVISAVFIGILASQARAYTASVGLRVLSVISIVVSMAVLVWGLK